MDGGRAAAHHPHRPSILPQREEEEEISTPESGRWRRRSCGKFEEEAAARSQVAAKSFRPFSRSQSTSVTLHTLVQVFSPN